MIRSLRWRLVLATALIIAAVVIATGFFSSVTVKREFNRYLIGQQAAERRAALDLLRRGVPPARVSEQLGMRMIVVDGARVVHRPPDMARFRIEVRGEELTLRSATELLKLQGGAGRIAGLGTVYLLPNAEEREQREFSISVDQRLIGGLAAAALMAVLVMLTVFRRVFAPVDALTRGARALAAGDRDVRVPVRGRDEVAELANAFNQLAESLERNERARRNMVSDVAHELRAPLTNIRVQVEAAQDGVAPLDLDSIAEEVVHLSRLVDDLQQLSLAEAGALQLELQAVNVRDLIESATRGFAVTVDAEEAVVHADPRRIVQVLRNLLVNASTYGSRVEVRAVTAGELVEIRVSDDGPGVPAEHREKIFDRFHRADASRSRATGGAGLGLAIAKELVELHGGRIWLEGASTFVFTLERRRPAGWQGGVPPP